MTEPILSRRRTPGWLWALAGCLLLALSLHSLPAFAQAKKDAKEAEAAAEKDAAPEEAAPPAAEGEGKPAGEAKGEAAPAQKNALVWLIETSGLIGLVILILSIYFVAT